MNSPDSKTHARRWRLQFSLRTFLIGSTLAALGIWWGALWYRRPDPAVEKLPGGLLLWDERQVETKDEAGTVHLISNGRFTVTDEQGRVWGQGKFDKGQAVGQWTWFRPDGRAALSGDCQRNSRTATWISWHEDGHTAAATEHHKPREVRSLWEFCAFASKQVGTKLETASNRGGKATLHHKNGKKQAEGNYENDMREGRWTFWDEKGHKAAAGAYRAGRRHGKWTFFDRPDKPRVTYYIVGREMPDLPQQITQLTEQLKSPDWRTRVEAIEALGEIGDEALPELIAVLKQRDPELMLRALRATARMGTAGEAALPDVRRLANSADQSTRVEGLFALFALDESSRDETFVRLLSPDNVFRRGRLQGTARAPGATGIRRPRAA